MDNLAIQGLTALSTASIMLLLYVVVSLKLPKKAGTDAHGWAEKKQKQCPTCHRWLDA